MDFYIHLLDLLFFWTFAIIFSIDTNTSIVTIDLGDQETDDDKYQYGILDGGHTYKAIISERCKIPADLVKYVRLEIITNVSNITRLSDARNTSVQVSDIALFNLDDKFKNIQEIIKDEPYADKVAYKDNEKKEYHIADILKLLYAFDILKFPDDSSAPVQSYSGKAQVFKRYKEAYGQKDNDGTGKGGNLELKEFYDSLIKQIPVLVKLYDVIECELPEAYVAYKKDIGTPNARFGAVSGIEPKDRDAKEKGGKGKTKSKRELHSYSLKSETKYSISSGYILPIFGAFRSIIRYDRDSKRVYWLFDPIEVWREVSKSLAQNTFESSRNPQLAGKDRQLWLTNYRIVETQSLRKQLRGSVGV